MEVLDKATKANSLQFSQACVPSTTLVRGVSGELEDENWRLCSATLVRGASWGAGS